MAYRLLSEDEEDAPPNLIEMGPLNASQPTIRNKLLQFHVQLSIDPDAFLTRLYLYYLGKGFSTILISKLFSVMNGAFVVIFSAFLTGCVDYKELFTSYDLSKAVSLSRILSQPWYLHACLIIFSLLCLWYCVQSIFEIKPLWQIRNIYKNELKIEERDLPTLEWKEVVKKIMELSQVNPQGISLNQHDIANRILRKDNYIIGLFNKKILNLQIGFFFLKREHILTKSLEWNLSHCVLGYFFDDRNNLKKNVLQSEHKNELVQKLRRRFIKWGLINLIASPFVFLYLLMFFVFKYGEEFHKNPTSIGNRQYTPISKFLFREFNEYPHLFQRRINLSVPKADEYVKQFPSEKIAILARFVSFISGAFAFVLAMLSIADEEILFRLDLSPGRSVLFYLGVFSAVFAFSRSFVPEDSIVFQPEVLMTEISEFTHYLPKKWRLKLHTAIIHREFSAFYQYKLIVFALELFGVLLTPLILCFNLPGCAEEIVDFFRNFSTEKPGVGYICSFADFDFKKCGNPKYGAPTEQKDSRFHAKNGKMEKSFLNFKANNPEWEPNDEGQEYLNRVNEAQQQQILEQSKLTSSVDTPNNFLNSAVFASMNSSLGYQSSSLHASGGGLMQILDKVYESNIHTYIP